MGSLDSNQSTMLNITATDDCLKTFGDMKLKHKIAYLVFHVTKNGIEVSKNVTKEDAGDECLDKFIADVKESGSTRFAVVDYNNKLLFVSWIPDTAKPKDKMTYASVKESFISLWWEFKKKIQATDYGELSKEVIIKETASKV